MCGLTEPLLGFNEWCEGSLAFKRGLGANQARARMKNDEGSAFDFRQSDGSVEPKDLSCTIKETVLYYKRNSSV